MYRLEYYNKQGKLVEHKFETSDQVIKFIVKNELTEYWYNNTFRLELR